MSFIEGIKKKFLGDESQVQKAKPGGRRVGSMGKAYTGGGGSYVSTSKGTGFDASSYSNAKPKGKVSNLNEFNPNRSGASSRGEKGILGKAYDYAAPKARAAGKWMQDRGMEIEKQNKKRSGRVPRGSQPPGYDGNYDMFGVGGFGGGGGGGWQTQGTIISGGEAYEEVVPRRRKKKTSRRAAPREREEGGFSDMNHIPDSLRGMF